MSKEITIDHKDISNAQNITPKMERIFKGNDIDLHVNEVVGMQDDFKKGKRHLRIKNTKYFFMKK